MELILIRHAEAPSDAGADPSLSAAGRAQAESVARFLAAEGMTHILTSPARRAEQTAGIVAAGVGVEVEVVDGLAEFDRDFGFYLPGHKLEGDDLDPRWQAMVDGRWDELGSTLTPAAFASKVVTTIEEIISRFPSRTVGIVTHGGVLNVYIGRVLGLPPWPLWFMPKNGSISRVAASRAGHRRLLLLNDDCWSR